MAFPTNSLHSKRARSSTNIPKEMQKEEYNRRRRAQRRASAAAKRNKQFDEFYMTGSMHTIVSDVAANPTVDSVLHLSIESTTLAVAIDSTDLQAQSVDPPILCDLAIGGATCSHQDGDNAVTTTSAVFNAEGVTSRSPAPSHIAVDRPTHPHTGDEVAMETDLLESLLPSPSMEQNSATEDDPGHNDLDVLPCSTAPTIESSTAVPDPTEELAKRLSDQLIQHHGCCSDCHRQGQEEHEEEHEQHWGLQQYLDHFDAGGSFPDVLSVNRLAKREDRLADQIPIERKKEIYNGVPTARSSSSRPLHICLATEDRQPTSTSIMFDIDSVVGFPTSLAIAQQGIHWHPTQMPVSDLQSSLHLNPIPVHYEDRHGHAHMVRQPVHQVPHYTFGRLAGFEEISLYLLFPRLYREDQQCSRLRDEDFKKWMDEVLLPVIYHHQPSSMVQHYPSSHDHSMSNATARGVELRAQRVESTARQQLLHYFIPPESLHPIWEDILHRIDRPGLRQFQDVQILLQAKNLKTMTKDWTWQQMMQRFHGFWEHAVDLSYTSANFYFDIGKEVCPAGPSYIAMEGEPTEEEDAAQTLMWKRCCLDSYAAWIQSAHGPKEDGHHRVFYPLSLLHDTGSVTFETHLNSRSRQAGLLYSQFYSSVKEIFAAGNVYPFTNTALETLALDPQLRKTWQSVGGGLSHDPVALMRAYLYTKARCHRALTGSPRKSFGTREEHRVSRRLLDHIDQEFRRRNVYRETFTSGETARPYYCYSTSTISRWFRWNINKFCVGFESVYSFHDHHFVTWEHTRMMLMFLRCLQFSYSTGLIQRVGGCWHDVRVQSDVNRPDGIRRWEGLGFRDQMAQYGYAWFLDKVDWSTMTFRQPFAQYMMFNNPSMQAAYHTRYRQVRDVRVDFIRVDQVRQWMMEFSAVPTCQDYLEKYLRQLCLCAFRKDVFAQIRPFLRKEAVEAALAGETPLCWPSVNEALQEQYRPPYLATGNRLAVKRIDVLFTWLWEWKDGRFERKGWSEKPYRMLYRKSFEAIALVRGKNAARAWKQTVYLSLLRSHWLLPYPQNGSFMRKSKEAGRVMWWGSVHHGLDDYYQRLAQYGPLPQPFPASSIKHHPDRYWQGSSSVLGYMDYTVQPEQRLVHHSDAEKYEQLLDLQRKFNNHPSVITPSAPRIYEIQRIIHDPQKTRAPMETWSVETCSIQLRKALEEQDLLHHHGYHLRARRKNRPTVHNDSDSSPEVGDISDSDDMTSDEESLGKRQLRQIDYIQKIEKQMYHGIRQSRKKSPQHPRLYESMIKLYAASLRRLPHHPGSILQLLNVREKHGKKNRSVSTVKHSTMM